MPYGPDPVVVVYPSLEQMTFPWSWTWTWTWTWTWSWTWLAVSSYLIVEVIFLVVHYGWILPFGNRLREPIPIAADRRGKPRTRREVLRRLLRSLERDWHESLRSSSGTGIHDSSWRASVPTTFSDAFDEFVASYFSGSRLSTATATGTGTATATSTSTRQTIGRNDLDTFLAWGLFDRPHEEMTPSERNELRELYEYVEREHGLHFPSGPAEGEKVPPKKACLLNVDRLTSLPRPLAVYLGSAFLHHVVARTVLSGCLGFRRMRTREGIVYWWRPPSCSRHDGNGLSSSSSSSLSSSVTVTVTQPPLVFFHGIAPGGLALYLPLLVGSLLPRQEEDGDREVYLFENPALFCQWIPLARSLWRQSRSPTTKCTSTFTSTSTSVPEERMRVHAYYPTERQVVEAVAEVMSKHSQFDVVGHSFGTCQITWLLRSSEVSVKIRRAVLLDPVTILLWKPDTVRRLYYYRRDRGGDGDDDNDDDDDHRFQYSSLWARAKIRWCASTEVGIEHYIRRGEVAWYNCELWLDDVDVDVDVDGTTTTNNTLPEIAVCLSGRDEIIRAKAVKQEIEHVNARERDATALAGAPRIELTWWPEGYHGTCLYDPSKWDHLRRKVLSTSTSTRTKVPFQ